MTAELSIRDLARTLGVPYSTLQDRILRMGRDDAVASFSQPVPDDGGEIPVIVREYDEERHLVYPLGDVHLGSMQHDAKKWAQWLQFVQSRKTASVLGTGDFLNTAILGGKSDVYDEQMTVKQSKRILRKQLEPIADRIDAICPGNHEDRISRAIGDCPISDVAELLGVPYFAAAAVIIYVVGDQEYHLYVRHGSGNGQSLTQLAKSGNVIQADIYVTGHTHRQAVTADDYYVIRDRQIIRRKRYFVSAGSFIGYERYAAQRGYPPSRLGAPRIELSGKKWDVHISL
jgi:hypothetical protein